MKTVPLLVEAPREGTRPTAAMACPCRPGPLTRRSPLITPCITRCLALGIVFLSLQTLPVRAAAFAEGIVAYDPGIGFAVEFGSGLGYTNPGVALGPPNPDTPFGAVMPFNPPFSRDEIVSLGVNGSLVVSFGMPIFNDPAHPFGLDFIIYGSTGFIDSDFPNGRTDASASVFGNNSGMTRVSVSAGDGIFYTLNPSFAPTVDAFFPTDGAGTFGLPVSPTLQPADFANHSLADLRALYAGSAGGAGYDLSWALDANGQPVNLSTISLVRIDVLNGRAEIDGFAAVPEPAPWLLGGLSALLTLAWKRIPKLFLPLLPRREERVGRGGPLTLQGIPSMNRNAPSPRPSPPLRAGERVPEGRGSGVQHQPTLSNLEPEK